MGRHIHVKSQEDAQASTASFLSCHRKPQFKEFKRILEFKDLQRTIASLYILNLSSTFSSVWQSVQTPDSITQTANKERPFIFLQY